MSTLEALAAEAVTLLGERAGGALLVVMTSGPGATAELLGEVLVRLPAGEEVVGHRLDVDGVDPTGRYRPGRVVVVHGFESVPEEARVEALVALNRARDQLREMQTRLILCLPTGDRPALHRHATDLFAWRDAVLEVPGPTDSFVWSPPVWEQVRDLCARRLVAVVGDDLRTPEYVLARRLIERLPWGAVYDVGEGEPVLPALAEGRVQQCRDFTDVWLAQDESLLAYARMPAAGVNRAAHPWPRDSRWVHHALLPRRAIPDAVHAGDASSEVRESGAAVVAWAVGLLLARMEPLGQAAELPIPAPARSGAPCLLVLGPGELLLGLEDGAWRDLVDAVLESGARDRRWTTDGVLRQAGTETADGPVTLARTVAATALDVARAATAEPGPSLGLVKLLADTEGPVLVTGTDPAAPSLLARAGVAAVVVGDDQELDQAPKGARVVLQPWGSALAGTARLPWHAWEGWAARNPRCVQLIRSAMRGDVVFLALDPADPRFVLLAHEAWAARPVEPGRRLLVHPWDLPAAEVWSLAARGVEAVSTEGRSYDWRRRDPGTAASEWLARHSSTPHALDPRPNLPYELDEAGDRRLARIVEELLVSQRVGGASVIDQLAAHRSFRVVGPPGVGKSACFELLAAGLNVFAASRSGPWAYVHRLPTLGVAEARVVRSHLGRRLRSSVEGWLAQPRPRAGDRLLVVDELHRLSATLRAELAPWLGELTRTPGLRVIVVDRAGPPSPEVAGLPTFPFEPRRSLPSAWYEHVCRANSPALAALPALARLASGAGPVAERLSVTPTALSLEPTLGDPIDPFGPALAAGVLGADARQRIASGVYDPVWGSPGPPPPALIHLLGGPVSEAAYAELLAPSGAEIPADDLASDALPALIRAGLPLPVRALPEVLAGEIPRHAKARPWVQARVTVAAGVVSLGSGARRARLDAFSIDLLPVTRARYQVFVDAGGYAREDLWHPDGWAWRSQNGITGPAAAEPGQDAPDHPMTGVSWYEADAWLRWRGQRLPTEWEWEVAAARGAARFGLSQVDVIAHAVPADGPADMGGNVFEWCTDWFDALYLSIAPDANPAGPLRGVERSVRGPAWWVKGADRDPTRRWHFPPEYRAPDVGFRGVTAAPPVGRGR